MASRIHQPTRQRLVALLAADHLDGSGLIQRLRQLRRLEGVATCSAMLHLLTHLELPEDEAEQLLVELNSHRSEVGATLGRDPGLPVAAVDYLSNVRGLLRNPTIVELDELETTERSAVTDSLTGLHNRRYFDSALDIETRRSMRYGLGLSLLLLDLDLFKPINDLHGHRLGDLVLARVGGLLRRAVRDADVACRFGGEEFAVILPETGRLGAFSLGERVRLLVQKAFEEPFEGLAIELSVSGGVATFPRDGETAEMLVERADRAMYLAKKEGRNRIVLYHSERRRFVRFPVRSNARVWLRAGGSSGIEMRPINLSRSGALLSTTGPTRTEGTVELKLRMREREWVVSGKVVRSGRRSLAVRFDRPLPEDCFEGHVRRSVAPRAARS
ncbi:MAG: diguanylate cyclase [Acidobacteria bacterium]|nr:diguanylate cyclase [Acidobacteriota bacterium]NIM64236.1 diguanylate cyclase [Acidobacteriota bacterium]NIO59234.1 diguanylate cyclase [Acidobacteriota bacterium]NIQ30261.1 diguanylate cyclase [Acidobacteriota bacterium]NIQ85189.1 diguanylate cyclase [Acidobacteriota bacterium]